MNTSCNIIEDLLPLYLENCCSEDSRQMVHAHLQVCPRCQEQYTLLKAGESLNQTSPPAPSLEITVCAKKVRRHRRRVGLITVLCTLLCAWFAFMCCLTLADMHRQANPTVFPVEDGVYNLTAADLETTAGQLENYILFTNYSQIQVSVSPEIGFDGQILLWDASSLSAPVIVQCGRIDSNNSSCTFSGLTSARRYMITCEADAQMPLTVSEGRTVHFLYSFGQVSKELLDYFLYILQQCL